MSVTGTKSELRRKTSRPRVARRGRGVVRYYLQRPLPKGSPAEFTTAKLIETLEAGLSVTELTDLQASLDLPLEKLAPLLGISKATLHRLKGTGARLGPAVSDRVVRLARLLGQALQVFGDVEDARRWLGSPQFGLGGAVPLEYAKTEVGAREVENLLGRVEYGVYS